MPVTGSPRGGAAHHERHLHRGRSFEERPEEAEEILARVASLSVAAASHRATEPAAASPATAPRSMGRFLASRLADHGVKHFLAVPGDFNLALLDEMLAEPRLQMVTCCGELGAGYAADGYARSSGLACLVLTFSVGALSAINAVAGAYAEDVPVVVVVGAPGTAAWGSQRVIHHSLGRAGDLDFELNCFKQVTASQALVRDLPQAYHEIDRAISVALTERKPCYLSLPCNLVATPHPCFAAEPAPMAVPRAVSSPENLEAAVRRAAAFLNAAARPVLLCGARMRSTRARAAVLSLAEAAGMATAVMANAKGFFPEDHPNYIGVFWSSISTPYTGEIVVSADAVLAVGPVLSDGATVGFTDMIDPGNVVEANPRHVSVGVGHGAAAFFGRVVMEDFLEALLPHLKPAPAALSKWRQMYVPPGVPPPAPPDSPLAMNRLYCQIQELLSSGGAEYVVLVDCGDSWFHAFKLRLPRGCAYELQMLYASIGWSVGAALGYALADRGRRVLAIVGDGAFQMTGQELATALRQKLNPIIFVINNGAYSIESEVHDGVYNNLRSWDYAKFAEALDNGEGRVAAFKVRTEAECAAAVAEAAALTDRAVFIECIVDRSDCSVELLQFGRTMQFASRK